MNAGQWDNKLSSSLSLISLRISRLGFKIGNSAIFTGIDTFPDKFNEICLIILEVLHSSSVFFCYFCCLLEQLIISKHMLTIELSIESQDNLDNQYI